MSPRLVTRLIVIAAAMTLVGLGLIVWGLFGRGPIPIFMSMTLGQGIGTCAFALYLFVVFTELWHTAPAGAQAAPDGGADDGDGDAEPRTEAGAE